MWNPWKKSPLPRQQPVKRDLAGAVRAAHQENRGFVAAPDELEDVARQTEAQREPEYDPEADKGEPSGLPEQETLAISEADAAEIVKWIYSHPAKFDHPAWAVTEEEAHGVAPKMQAMVQALLDRHMPQFIVRIMNRYPEAISLAAAMLLLTYAKAKAVKLAKVAEARIEQEAARMANAKNVTPVVETSQAQPLEAVAQ
jgi:hypothetical protein